ncbi:MAG: N-carbamoyl-L-amino-acid hydrolase [Planctomycetota bacterium]|jgi:N-carbamoyl-L-amino-acid hydrolase
MAHAGLHIDSARLSRRLVELARIGALEGGGVCRLALTAEDRAGRDQVCSWMREVGLELSIDRIGNVLGTRKGRVDGAPVMSGSHIDTVRTGGLYDGNLGVLAAIEVAEVLRENGIETTHPYAAAFFTNEEGARFAPDMMGSGVHQGALDLDAMLQVRGIDDRSVDECLQEIGYAGSVPCGAVRAHSYLELHVEQGPILEREGLEIGAVDSVQGISWQELELHGTSNHAGTTPMALRNDPGFVASQLAVFMRELARRMGGNQVATVGRLELTPNLINVIPSIARMTVDLRNTDESLLQAAEAEFAAQLEGLAQKEGVEFTTRSLARFEPVRFDDELVGRVETAARNLGHSVRRMPSGAGHDAQMFAPNCPAAMVFVPSRGGISHNVTEYTAPEQIEAGANVLLRVLLEQLG